MFNKLKARLGNRKTEPQAPFHMQPKIRDSHPTKSDQGGRPLLEGLSTSEAAQNLLHIFENSSARLTLKQALAATGSHNIETLSLKATLADALRSPERCLASADELATVKRHSEKLRLLNAAVLNFTDHSGLLEALASGFAVSNQNTDAARSYLHLAENFGHSFYHYWNASTLALIDGNIDLALQAWQKARAADSSQARLQLFEPLFHAIEHLNDANLVQSLEQLPALLEPQPDWIQRRFKTAYSRVFPSQIISSVSTEALEQLETVSHQIGMEAAWLSGWGFTPIEQARSVEMVVKIAKAKAESGQRIAALDAATYLSEHFPDTPKLASFRALCFTYAGSFDDALKAINGVTLSDNEKITLVETYLPHHDAVKFAEFIDALKTTSLKSQPVLQAIGQAAFECGAHDIADASFSALLSLDPAQAEARYQLAVSQHILNKPAEALQNLDYLAAENSPNAKVYADRAQLKFHQSDFTQAIADLETSLTHDANQAETQLMLAVALRCDRQHARAASVAKSVLEQPNCSQQILNQARLLWLSEACLSQQTTSVNEAADYAHRTGLKPDTDRAVAKQLLVFLYNIGEKQRARDVNTALLIRAPEDVILQFWQEMLRPSNEASNPATSASSLANKLAPLLRVQRSAQPTRGDMEALGRILVEDPGYADAAFVMASHLIETEAVDAARPHLAYYLREGDNRRHILNCLSQLDLCDENTQRTDAASAVWPETDLPIGPVITLGVPAYNEVRYLSDALNSIWFQTFPLWQCLIVDDHSTDTSRALASDYAAVDKRFAVLLHLENKGLSAARNSALQAATARYVSFIDGDDYLTANSLWNRLETMTQAESDPLCCGTYGGMQHAPEMRFNQSVMYEPAIRGKHVNFLTSGYNAPFNAHAPILNRRIIRDLGGFDETMHDGAEDWDCWSRLLRQGYNFRPSDQLCAFYRAKRGSMVRSKAARHVSAAKTLINKLGSPLEDQTALLPYSYAQTEMGSEFTRRAISFAAMALMSGDRQGVQQIIQQIPFSGPQLEALNIDIETLSREGVKRYLGIIGKELQGIDASALVLRKTKEVATTIEQQLRQAAVPLDAELTPETQLSDTPTTAAQGQFYVPPAYLILEEKDHAIATTDQLRRLKNTHLWERCFIIGNGPSLNQLDLTKIGDEVAFGVNGIFYKCDEIGWWPRYYVVEDSSVMNENLERILTVPSEKKFFPTNYSKLHPHQDHVNFFVMNRGFYEVKSPNFGIPRFSTDAAERVYCGQSVTYINLQLAYHMGFSEVYLIGMDFSYQIPQAFEKKGDMIVSTGDDPNHFHPDYFGKGKSWKDPKLEKVLLNYQMAKFVFEAAGRKIFNATAGGRLEAFDRVDYDSLF